MREFNQPMWELDVNYIINLLISFLTILYYIAIPYFLFKIYLIIKKLERKINKDN